MTSSNAQERNTKHILLNNLGNKHRLVMEFGKFIYYKKLSKHSKKNMAWKLVSEPF